MSHSAQKLEDQIHSPHNGLERTEVDLKGLND